ncbi:unnamed protein product [Acanthoscelides obtectus]|uniref:Uncharacterized protein n=1 Tax=Acanthoscelides obtectus TaxID=200917 RepID=A0A9P0JNA5_ACAOB|nr:unnamed protein product [Acanthoscelides obtectus]CAK1662032.1 hypothetical protein AOBTE_LOCUS22942 [Acanthoscelides obtectus]
MPKGIHHQTTLSSGNKQSNNSINKHKSVRADHITYETYESNDIRHPNRHASPIFPYNTGYIYTKIQSKPEF